MLTNVLLTHFYVGVIFFIYILIDRLYIRVFVSEDKRSLVYSRVKYPMALIALILVSSGVYLVFFFSFELLIAIKAILAGILLVAFFYCPLYMKTECSLIKRMLYRYLVLILTITVFCLGVYI